MKLGLGGSAILVAAFLLSGSEGVLFSGAIALAFAIGTLTRSGPLHPRRLLQPDSGGPVSRAALDVRLAVTSEGGGVVPGLCIVLGIDGFDALHRQHGERAAKAMQDHLAMRLFCQIRRQDCVAHAGEGRFAVLLTSATRIDLETAVQTALRLLEVTDRPVQIDGLALRLTMSAGLALAQRRRNGESPADLLDSAETALDLALALGPRNLRVHDPADRAEPRPDAAHLAAPDLARAFDAGEIVPWFQPQIATETGALTGIEALARWNHPARGILAPARFLPQIEAQNLSSRLTSTILDGALHHLAAWDDAGLEVPRVSINLGTADLADPTLIDRIAWALDKHGLAPARLGIEVLETVVAHSHPDDVAARTILGLGKLGCLIDMDDFGTGSASINGIRRFAIHRLKIDRSLITALDRDEDQRAMVAAILTMAAQLGVDVLAEGVETPEEHAVLAQLGCGHVQGYAIARPMPAADLVGWLKRARRGDVPSPAPPLHVLSRRARANRRRHAGPGGETA